MYAHLENVLDLPVVALQKVIHGCFDADLASGDGIVLGTLQLVLDSELVLGAIVDLNNPANQFLDRLGSLPRNPVVRDNGAWWKWIAIEADLFHLCVCNEYDIAPNRI